MDQGRTEILRGVDRCAQRVFDHLAVGRAERRGHRVEVGQIDGNAGEDSTVFGLLFLVEVERIAVCQREVFFHGSKLQLDGSQAEILQHAADERAAQRRGQGPFTDADSLSLHVRFPPFWKRLRRAAFQPMPGR